MSVKIIIENEGYPSERDLYQLLDYVQTDKATGRKCFYRGYLYTSPTNAYNEFIYVKNFYGKCSGRNAKHIIISVEQRDLLADSELYELAFKFAKFFGDKRQIVFGIHTNTDHHHIHMAINTVSFIDGSKLHESYADFYALKAYIERTLQEYKHRRGY